MAAEAPIGINVSAEHEPLLRRLDGITPLLNENAERSEALGRLTEVVVEALHDTGVFRVCIPRELGGYEFSPRQILDTVSRLSYADSAASWSVMALQMVTGTTAAYLGADAARDLFADVGAGRHALIAGQGTKPGTAVRADGGYRITGHWHFASGLPMASHIHTAALCAETGESLVCTLPKEHVEQVDNWDVMGLRATGSIDYRCEDVFVPSTHAYEAATTDNRHGGAMYRMGLVNMSAIFHSGWALGVGRRMLDEMKALAAKKTGGPNASVDTGQFHAEFAAAESRLRSARAWAMEVWADNEATLGRGELLSAEQETLTRLMLNNATWSAQAVGETVYKWAGTAALRRGVLQRFFRDLHAGTQHVTSGPVVLQNCGKWLSGLASESAWVFLDLNPTR
ncbi:acyl-CoA dehydrogenase [Saccharopolyspora gloriosae]|uniref:acyl-CoA dehydrogenase n=1 Tax=Saccharopolyspora gloriosae TaxID=455344 RepID=UPI001FB7B8F7|nr:acyl-CoA dehydrogenase [Saccharopolyspora gloriosae]